MRAQLIGEVTAHDENQFPPFFSLSESTRKKRTPRFDLIFSPNFVVEEPKRAEILAASLRGLNSVRTPLGET